MAAGALSPTAQASSKASSMLSLTATLNAPSKFSSRVVMVSSLEESGSSREVCAEHIFVKPAKSAVALAAPIRFAAVVVAAAHDIAEQPGRPHQGRPHQEIEAMRDSVVPTRLIGAFVAVHDVPPFSTRQPQCMTDACIYMCDAYTLSSPHEGCHSAPRITAGQRVATSGGS